MLLTRPLHGPPAHNSLKAHSHTHTSYLNTSHISAPHFFSKSHACMHKNTATQFRVECPPPLLFHSPPTQKGQEPGMRRGSKWQVSGWKAWDDRWGALWHYEWIIPPKYLEQCWLSACIYTNLGENIAVSTLKGVDKEWGTELIEQSGH